MPFRDRISDTSSRKPLSFNERRSAVYSAIWSRSFALGTAQETSIPPTVPQPGSPMPIATVAS